jgi:hypothetical protein
MSGPDGKHSGNPQQSQEEHQNIISHAAEKFHLKKPARVVAEKTVREGQSRPRCSACGWAPRV